MTTGPDLNVINILLSALPLLILLAAILILKWSAPKAGATAFLAVATIALLFFGVDSKLLAIGSAKGLSLSLFVLSIIWSSVLLYNIVDEIGGIDVIGRTMTRLVSDPLAQALVVGWAFSGFMQGIAGFGVPVAVVAPLMVFMGFTPALAAAIVLIGHSWAVTFGSVGSSVREHLASTKNNRHFVLCPGESKDVQGSRKERHALQNSSIVECVLNF